MRRRLGIALEPGDLGRAITFASSLIVIVVSLNGPLHDLSDRYLFSTHMIQHLLLAQVFPLLFILGIPTWLWRWLLGGRAVHAGWSWLAACRSASCSTRW